MKAIVVKDNDFKTVGFEVTANAKTLFSWGISPISPFYWTKAVSVNDWMTEIFELVRINAQISEARNFTCDFFAVALENKLVKNGQAVKFGEKANRVQRLEEKLENIIKNII